MKAAVYVDGFNLYYGVAKPLNCKWVNLQSYFEAHFPADDIVRVFFFEAMITGPSRANQEAYVDALEAQPKLSVILGDMKHKRRYCKVSGCAQKNVAYWPDFEEKHTDVSIAIQMVSDTYRASYDKLILVTADTDLVPAVRMVKAIRPQQKVTLCIPAVNRNRIWGAKPIADLADTATRADAELFLKCQFPVNVAKADGTAVTRPASWPNAPLTALRVWRANNPGQWLDPLPSWCR